jgi:hypothetical protein
VSTGEFLVLRRSGGVWALPDACVRAVSRHGPCVRVATAAGAVVADEVIAFAQRLEVRAPGGVLSEWWGESCAGLAVLAGVPVVVLDPAALPQALREEGASSHAK